MSAVRATLNVAKKRHEIRVYGEEPHWGKQLGFMIKRATCVQIT